GQACTIEDWIAVFEEAAGRDLSQFKRWYGQAGTPRVDVSEDWRDGSYTLTLRQHTPPTPGQPLKEPLLIPVAMGLIGPDGDEVLPTQVLELDSPEQSFTFDGLSAKPVASLLRGFSAPVILNHALSSEDRALLLAHDTDPVNRFESGRALARDILLAMIREGAKPGPVYLDALRRMLRDDTLDPAFRALALGLPSQDDLASALFDAGEIPDPDAIHHARQAALQIIADALAPVLATTFTEMQTPGPYSPDARDAGRRALRVQAVGLLARVDGGAKAREMFAQANNMTEQLGAWGALLAIGEGEAETAQFYRQWTSDRLVLDKWFAAQVSQAAPERAAALARRLTEHADFDWKNPNRFRSVIGALGANPAGFHARDGASYQLVADWLIRLDGANPQAAARVSTLFETWRRYDPARQALIRAQLERIMAHPGLSRDMGEMVGRMLE
ncbi:MAG: DUF3458 domain-containing protein, partial [Natronohydrobacter sp.]|nr:DUF3458 domain-containing protein [Natronohydrobacter sp.]